MHCVKWSILCPRNLLGEWEFKDLRLFNDALLGKQVWRLFHEKSTLLCRVFHAKYFPNGSIVDAKDSPSSSFKWQSILLARDVLTRGAIWRVGNGRNIRIWDHRWFPELNGCRLVSLNRDPHLSIVGDLFCFEPMSWKSTLVDQTFLPWEVESIKNIPLSYTTHDDSLVWPFTQDGQYSVKSAYQLVSSALFDCQPWSFDLESRQQ